MNRIYKIMSLTIVLIMIALLGSNPIYRVRADGNLINDGDFEIWSDVNHLTYWYSGRPTDITQETINIFSGSYSAKYFNADYIPYIAQHGLSLISGKTYLISGWLNTPGWCYFDILTSGWIGRFEHIDTGIIEYFQNTYIAIGDEEMILIQCQANTISYIDDLSIVELPDTPTPSDTPTSTPTDTLTPIPPTSTFTFTPSNTFTSTPTHTPTFTATNTETLTPTFTFTPTLTFTPTITRTPTYTKTLIPAAVLTSTYEAAYIYYSDVAEKNYPMVIILSAICGLIILGLIGWGVVTILRKRSAL